MKWIKVKSSADHTVYELWHDDHRSLTLTHSPSGFTKIECDDVRRNFIIEKKGIFRTRIILRNEYGIRLGLVTFEGNHNDEGIIEMEGQRLRYTIHIHPTPEMVIYKPSNQPLLICDLGSITGNSFTFLKSSTENIYPALLLALCWHHFTKVSKAPELEFAI